MTISAGGRTYCNGYIIIMKCVLYYKRLISDERDKATSLLKNLEMKAHYRTWYYSCMILRL